MDNPIPGVSVKDELNLCLVAGGLKPASEALLSPLNFARGDGIRKVDGKQTHLANFNLRLDLGNVYAFRTALQELGVVYSEGQQTLVQAINKKRQSVHVMTIPYKIGHDKRSLARLVGAQNSEERGMAFGIPREAISAYNKAIDGELRDIRYLEVCMAKVKQAGLKLPLWLAYIHFVPEQLDLVGGKVSPSSKALGTKYQSFIRENSPDLAARVENHFLQQKLPESWQLKPDGSYILRYKPDKNVPI